MSVFICIYVNMKTETFAGILIGLSVSGAYLMKFILCRDNQLSVSNEKKIGCNWWIVWLNLNRSKHIGGKGKTCGN